MFKTAMEKVKSLKIKASDAYAAAGIALWSTIALPMTAFAEPNLGTKGNELLNSVKDLFGTLVIFGGGALLVWGAVKLGTAIKDQNGPGISDAMWQVVGGLIVCGSGVLFKGLTL